MTRWLYLCNDLGIPLDGTKGASEHVQAITRALAGRGCDVVVLAARGRLPSGHPARQLDAPAGKVARAAQERLRAWILSVGEKASLGTEMAQLLHDAELDGFLRDGGAGREFDVAVERLSLFCSAGRRFARRIGAAYLREMNAPLAREAARYRDGALRELATPAEQQALAGADLVMTVSDDLRRFVVADCGVDPQRVVAVPNGVDVGDFAQEHEPRAARREMGVPTEAVVFGFVGSLKAWYGVDVLLDAFARVRERLPGAHLLVVGGGRLAPAYADRARELGIDHDVTFLGEAEHARIPRLLAVMDVALAPYLPQENFYFSPLKLYEYMAAGLPVIASDAGQIAEVIAHGRNGLLCTPGRSDDLARLMLEAGQDASLRARLGRCARDSVKERGWDQVAARIIDLARQAPRLDAAPALEGAHVG